MANDYNDAPCGVCGRPKSQHLNSIHEYRGPGEGNTLTARRASDESSNGPSRSSQGVVRNLLGGDPIIRLLLIRKGLITHEELLATEEELKAAGIAVAEPVGQPRGS